MKLKPITIGIDEVGRGALAGPLIVGVASLDLIDDRPLFLKQLLTVIKREKLTDSKKLSPAQRQRAFTWLEDKILWGIGEVEPAEIDYFGLTVAVTLAAERALASLKKRGYLPKTILADAGLNHPFETSVPTTKTVKGDEKITEISLASIIAKVWRDRVMVDLSVLYPEYGWESNKGYGTKKHLQAVQEKGINFIHRRLFLRKIASNLVPQR